LMRLAERNCKKENRRLSGACLSVGDAATAAVGA
jgi:hypothetical protein